MLPLLPYWLSVATVSDMLSLGVWLPPRLEACFVAQVSRHNEQLGMREAFVSAWHCRPIRQNLISAVGLYEKLHFVREHPPMTLGVHGQAVDIDRAAAQDPHPHAFHAQFVERHAEDTGAVPFSVCILGSKKAAQPVPNFFSHVTQQVIARIRSSHFLVGYGFDCVEEDTFKFLPLLPALARLRQQLLIRSQGKPVAWGAFDSFVADTQALVLGSASRQAANAPALVRL